MRDAGFDVSFRDCPAKGGTGGQSMDDQCSIPGNKSRTILGPTQSPINGPEHEFRGIRGDLH
jgi:hypothetical protein